MLERRSSGGHRRRPSELDLWYSAISNQGFVDSLCETSFCDLGGHRGRVWAVAISADGLRLATGSQDRSAIFWDASAAAAPPAPAPPRKAPPPAAGAPPAPPGSVSLLRLRSPSETERRASALGLPANGGALAPWRALSEKRGKCSKSLKGHRGSVLCVAIHDLGHLVITGSLDTTGIVWQVGTGRALSTLRGHQGFLRGVCFGKGDCAVTCASDKSVRIWEIFSGKCLRTLNGHSHDVTAVRALGDLLATSSMDGTARLWDAATGAELLRVGSAAGRRAEGAPANGDSPHELSANGRTDARVSTNGRTDEQIATNGRTDQEFATNGARRPRRGAALFCVALGGGRLLCGGASRIVYVYSSSSGRLLQRLIGHRGVVLSVAISGDGSLAVSGGEDGSAILWDVESGRRLQTMSSPSGRVLSVDISADGKIVAKGTDDGKAEVWDARGRGAET